MKLAALFSGGKDSTYAAYLAQQAGNKIVCLINIRSENPDSYMFHVVNNTLTEKQAELMGIPLMVANTHGRKEEELTDLENAIKKAMNVYGIEGVTAGAVASEYQATRVEKICQKLGISLVAPFWKGDPEKVIREMIDDNFEFIIVRVAAEGLDDKWLGRLIDQKAVDELVQLNKKYGVHIMFEGGEADTLVLNCPMFKKPMKILETEKQWDPKGKEGFLIVKKIE